MDLEAQHAVQVLAAAVVAGAVPSPLDADAPLLQAALAAISCAATADASLPRIVLLPPPGTGSFPSTLAMHSRGAAPGAFVPARLGAEVSRFCATAMPFALDLATPIGRACALLGACFGSATYAARKAVFVHLFDLVASTASPSTNGASGHDPVSTRLLVGYAIHVCVATAGARGRPMRRPELAATLLGQLERAFLATAPNPATRLLAAATAALLPAAALKLSMTDVVTGILRRSLITAGTSPAANGSDPLQWMKAGLTVACFVLTLAGGPNAPDAAVGALLRHVDAVLRSEDHLSVVLADDACLSALQWTLAALSSCGSTEYGTAIAVHPRLRDVLLTDWPLSAIAATAVEPSGLLAACVAAPLDAALPSGVSDVALRYLLAINDLSAHAVLRGTGVKRFGARSPLRCEAVASIPAALTSTAHTVLSAAATNSSLWHTAVVGYPPAMCDPLLLVLGTEGRHLGAFSSCPALRCRLLSCLPSAEPGALSIATDRLSMAPLGAFTSEGGLKILQSRPWVLPEEAGTAQRPSARRDGGEDDDEAPGRPAGRPAAIAGAPVAGVEPFVKAAVVKVVTQKLSSTASQLSPTISQSRPNTFGLQSASGEGDSSTPTAAEVSNIASCVTTAAAASLAPNTGFGSFVAGALRSCLNVGTRLCEPTVFDNIAVQLDSAVRLCVEDRNVPETIAAALAAAHVASPAAKEASIARTVKALLDRTFSSFASGTAAGSQAQLYDGKDLREAGQLLEWTIRQSVKVGGLGATSQSRVSAAVLKAVDSDAGVAVVRLLIDADDAALCGEDTVALFLSSTRLASDGSSDLHQRLAARALLLLFAHSDGPVALPSGALRRAVRSSAALQEAVLGEVRERLCGCAASAPPTNWAVAVETCLTLFTSPDGNDASTQFPAAAVGQLACPAAAVVAGGEVHAPAFGVVLRLAAALLRVELFGGERDATAALSLASAVLSKASLPDCCAGASLAAAPIVDAVQAALAVLSNNTFSEVVEVWANGPVEWSADTAESYSLRSLAIVLRWTTEARQETSANEVMLQEEAAVVEHAAAICWTPAIAAGLASHMLVFLSASPASSAHVLLLAVLPQVRGRRTEDVQCLQRLQLRLAAKLGAEEQPAATHSQRMHAALLCLIDVASQSPELAGLAGGAFTGIAQRHGSIVRAALAGLPPTIVEQLRTLASTAAAAAAAPAPSSGTPGSANVQAGVTAGPTTSAPLTLNLTAYR